VPQISERDYKSKQNEFQAWLKDIRRVYFEDLTNEEAKLMFDQFVKDWNRGNLDEKFGV
jgi:hypothetical protein